MICEHCRVDVLRLVIHDRQLWCWPCHDATKGDTNVAPTVIPDDIPGGVLVRHGLCNPDGSPRRYDSKSAMKREAAKRGFTNYVVHQPPPGSDKSKHTQRFV